MQVVAGFSSRRSGFSHWAVLAIVVVKKKAVLRQVFVLIGSHWFSPVISYSINAPCLSIIRGWFNSSAEVDKWFVSTTPAGKTELVLFPTSPNACRYAGHWKCFDWFYSEQNHDLCLLPSIICVIRPRSLWWAWHVARTGGRERCMQGFGGDTSKKDSTWKT